MRDTHISVTICESCLNPDSKGERMEETERVTEKRETK